MDSGDILSRTRQLLRLLCLLALTASVYGCAGGGLVAIPVSYYDPGAKANVELRALAERQALPIRVERLRTKNATETSWGCRGYGHVHTPDYGPLELYFRDALRAELRGAGLYSDDSPVTLRVNDGSASLITVFVGRWYLKGQFSWNDGTAFTVQYQHDSKHEMQPAMACSAAAYEFVSAVRGLMGALFAHPGFREGMIPSRARTR